METLGLADTEMVVLAAFNRYLDQKTGSFVVTLDDGSKVDVNVVVRRNRFDCGTPGYDMKNADVPVLREWVTDNIRQNGDVGRLGACKDVGPSGQVNVLTDWAVAFNFHVNLTDPCQ